MQNISEFLNQNFKLENLVSKNINDYNDVKNYFQNAEKDAVYFFNQISLYLNNNSKILEVGGGIHLLTNYLKKFYDVTSVEPGSYADGYANNIDVLREQILKFDNSKIYTTKLENFSTNEKFDFIFSMNVLEHTDDIQKHIHCCTKLLRNKDSILYIECPNYSFPYEPHFREFFIPNFPKFTFNKIKKKKLIKKFGEQKYYNILKSLNFKCNFNEIIKLESVQILNPIEIIFNRILNDKFFKQRILSNYRINLIYKIIVKFRLKKLLVRIFPKMFYPYLIMVIKNKM